MKITLVQFNILWEDKSGNLGKIEKIISGLYNKTDLIVLPEMFTTGFTMDPGQHYEAYESETFQWMSKIAAKGNFAICGSYIVKEGESYFNRWVLINSENKSWYYDKRHLFRMGDEDKKYSAGQKRVVINYKGVRFNPNICYDLRFPVWSRNRNDYDVLINVANWPDSRRDAWNTLLRARAIENQCYVVGVNRVGYDNKGLKYAGESVVIDPYGKIIAAIEEYSEGLVTSEISMNNLIEFRKKFPVWQDADKFLIE